ncbi:MAG: HDOD domain-containing protein [Sedimentisphaerales bacterium]|nr:HDOD domain-containing protein [Sedimentisphaerales bacterium]
MQKRQILFVDDEIRILDGLRRMLRSMHKEWEMHFVAGGQAALDFLAEHKCDIIVSDMRMPGIDGAKLMEHVRSQHPKMVRIALSGQTSKEMILNSVGPIHQYLPKPCDAETLKSTITRVSSLSGLLTNEKLQCAIAQLESLPCLSRLYTELMGELKSPDASIAKVSEIVTQDVSMTSKILHLVNSAFFGVRQRVTDIQQAVSLLGLETMSVLVLSIRIFGQFEDGLAKGFPHSHLWDHSLRVSRCARAIAEAEQASAEIAAQSLIAGTLHDIGKIILAAKTPVEYQTVLRLIKEDSLSSLEAERKVYDVTHAEIGSYLLGLWGFDDSVIEAIVFHHNPQASNKDEFSIITAVHVANAIVSESEDASVLGDSSEIDTAYLESIGLADRMPCWREACSEVGAVSAR